jgi:hypothetical protein
LAWSIAFVYRWLCISYFSDFYLKRHARCGQSVNYQKNEMRLPEYLQSNPLLGKLRFENGAFDSWYFQAFEQQNRWCSNNYDEYHGWKLVVQNNTRIVPTRTASFRCQCPPTAHLLRCSGQEWLPGDD